MSTFLSSSFRPAALAAALGLTLVLASQCRNAAPAAEAARVDTAGWDVVHEVLQHPRCVNCHPAGDVPLQGDDRRAHAQNVQRGPEGQGLFAMRCATCHQDVNAPGRHLPPGAPHWQLPHPDTPLVFEGKSSSELCRQLRDPAHNGRRTPEQLLEHVSSDPLVLWGWEPGEGRAPVPIEHATFVAAMRSWIEGGCACPE